MDPVKEATRFLEAHGLVNTTIGRCVDALTSRPTQAGYLLPGGFETYDIVCPVIDPEQAIRFLNEFTPPVVRHVLWEAGSSWTLCLNNSQFGFSDDGPSLAQRTCARAYRVVDTPGRVWKRADIKVVTNYEARIFTEYGADGGTVKSISAMNDGGRWDWSTNGPRYPIEGTFNYSARRMKDRFTSANLRSLLRSLGAPVVTSADLMVWTKCILLKSPGTPQKTVTLEELDDPAYGFYQRGLGWVPHIQTHASSVIYDLERAVLINPAYEPKVRTYIDAAKRILGDAATE
jgi:hypothetical protein